MPHVGRYGSAGHLLDLRIFAGGKLVDSIDRLVFFHVNG